jgi:hypothetical protein
MAKTNNNTESVEEAKTSEDTVQEAKTPDTAQDDDYVDHIPLFRDGDRYKDPLNVIINGKKYSVPRGVPLRLPRTVAEVIDQSIAQDAYANELNVQMQKTQVTEF